MFNIHVFGIDCTSFNIKFYMKKDETRVEQEEEVWKKETNIAFSFPCLLACSSNEKNASNM
jgi:hypothetical protein